MAVTCLLCDKIFLTRSNLNKHMRNIHHQQQRNIVTYDYNFSNIKCLSCASSFRFTKDLRYHLNCVHKEVINEETLQFLNAEDFQQWLTNLQKADNVEYVKCMAKGKIYYNCNRSGQYSVKDYSTRKRALKSQGSCKIGYKCTSEIIVSVDDDSVHNVVYYGTHYGHSLEIQHIRLSKHERSNIAAKLSGGVTISKVLEFKRNSFTESTISRDNLLTRKDIHNVKNSFGFSIEEGVRSQIDSISVELWVKECEGTEQVLFYKKQGEEHIYFKNEDFCLIYMNESQKLMLEKFGRNIISMDSTHGLNMYDFELTTISVIDEFGEGYPAACMFTNRKDTKVFEYFFTIIRDNAGIVKPKVFMTDITTVFYSAWEKIMGPVPNHFYCSWHIDRAWQTNLTKISNCEKRKWVNKTIEVVQECLDENEFFKHLQETINLLYNDDETKNFGAYFNDNYANNHRQWAYFFRKNCGINTNMHCESMHKNIKYFYLDGKVTKRLDKGLHALLKFIRDKTVERIIKITKGKNTSHVQHIHALHRAAISSKIWVKEQRNNYWLLRSSNTPTDFVVSRNTDLAHGRGSEVCCHLKCSFCAVCIHTFCCTCSDFCIRNTICKHIHFIAMKVINVSGTTLHANEMIFAKNTKNLEIEKHLSSLQTNNISQDTDTLKSLVVHEAQNIVDNVNSVSNEAILQQTLKMLRNVNKLMKVEVSPQMPNANTTLNNQPSNKKITKQQTFYSTKKKNLIRSKHQKKPYNAEKINIKHMLNGENVEFISGSAILINE